MTENVHLMSIQSGEGSNQLTYLVIGDGNFLDGLSTGLPLLEPRCGRREEASANIDWFWRN